MASNIQKGREQWHSKEEWLRLWPLMPLKISQIFFGGGGSNFQFCPGNKNPCYVTATQGIKSFELKFCKSRVKNPIFYWTSQVSHVFHMETDHPNVAITTTPHRFLIFYRHYMAFQFQFFFWRHVDDLNEEKKKMKNNLYVYVSASD